MAGVTVSVRPIDANVVESVSSFLHEHMNQRVSAAQWLHLMKPPWPAAGPNSGFLLADGDAVVGAYVAVYSERLVSDEPLKVCNLAAFCVLDEYRTHGLRLIRALLSQKGYFFTDLSPSGNVLALNERLGFERLPSDTRLVINVPWFATDAVTISSDPQLLENTLEGVDARVYRDHAAAPAAHHLLIQRQGGYGYLMYRHDRRKRLPLFASPLFVGGDRQVVEHAWLRIGAHLLRQGLLFTLAEPRVLGFEPSRGVPLRHPRPRMFRGRGLAANDVDYLYSELTLVAW